MQLLQSIWKDGYCYNKAGVMLADFYDQNAKQTSLSDDMTQEYRSKKLMDTVDKINESGLGTVTLASQGSKKNTWAMKREYLSPGYTTRWSDLPKAK